MSAPCAIAVTLTGNLIVVDAGNHRVLFYSGIPTTTGSSASFALMQPNLTTGTSGLTNSKLNTPRSVAVSATGQIAIADSFNQRVLLFYETPTAIGAAHAVLGQSVFTTDVDGATATLMTEPTGVCWNGTSLLVSGAGMKRTMKFSP